MKYTLKDDGYRWRVIYSGRNKVGRVWQHEQTKVYHAMIGKDEATGTSFVDAFRNVVAKALNFSSVQSLHQHNAKVRKKNRLMKRVSDHVVDEMLRGNFEPFGKVLESSSSTEMIAPIVDAVRRKV